jgi:hypothetical protein
VQRNWMVVGLEPTYWTWTKFSHPRACQMELNSESIPVSREDLGRTS